MKLSKHSKIRLRERTELNHRERRSIFSEALKYGKTARQIKDERIQKFMLARCSRCNIKLYKGYLFLYGKNSHILYTMYKLPDYLKEGEKENE